jgi:class 3 adenylate cyclase
LLNDANEHVVTELASNPNVVDVSGDDFDLDDLPVAKRKWTRIDEIVAVVADLKNSTQLGTGKHAASTASIYEAAVAPIADILARFDAAEIDVQGDAAVGVFMGQSRLERGFCAGVTIKTFSKRDLQRRLAKRWPDLPSTGFKLGLAASRILVKRIGVPGKPEYQEEVWAGKAVNYAAKAAQSADRNELIVTASVWDRLSSNDYITLSCGCGSDGIPSDVLWEDAEIDALPEDNEDRVGRKLVSMWCDTHGDEFCNAILAGKTTRPDANVARQALKSKLEGAYTQKRRRAQQQRVARLGRR